MPPARSRTHGSPAAVVFTDLDGTLLDHHSYSWQPAAPAVERLKRLGVPLVLASSKTRAEMVALRDELGINDPFIVENGVAIYVPSADGSEDGFDVEILGRRRDEILEILHEIRRRRGFGFEGFADWDVEGIRRRTGLDAASARAAGERDGTEPILWPDAGGADEESRELAEELARHELRLVRGGRFHHVMGKADKGLAVRRLMQRYGGGDAPPAAMSPVSVSPDSIAPGSIALGDSDNDVEMLRAVDHPVVIPRAVGEPLDPGPLPGLLVAPEPGPKGWQWAVDRLLDEIFLT